MKNFGHLLWLVLFLGICGCAPSQSSGGRTGTWRASNDYGDKPGNGIELQFDEAGNLQGRFFLLQPEKSDDFSKGVSFPMAISRHGETEILFSVDFGNGQRDRMRLSFVGKSTADVFEAILQDQGGGDAPIKFVFRRIK